MDMNRCAQVLDAGHASYTSDGHKSSSSGRSQKPGASNALLKSI